MEIKERNNTLILLNDKRQAVGELGFSKSLDSLIVTRSFINPAFRGQGLAELLMKRAIEIAKNENLKISATCSYGVKYIENHKEELKNLI